MSVCENDCYVPELRLQDAESPKRQDHYPLVTFTVLGRPQQRGSKQAVLIPKRGGGFIEKNGRPIVRAKDDNPKSKDWMQEVRSAAAQAFGQGRPLINEPIELTVRFYFTRPQSHYGSGKNSGKLKDSAPKSHAQSPDLAKLIRCLEDALKGIVWTDDKLVFRYTDCARHWTETQERAEVAIYCPKE